ncbi:MAG: arsinothricin resistance N-acetyltransferase ArsN1 family A [Pseudomonadota bacterium]
MGITIRAAVADDAPGICIVYNQGIEDRIATFETQTRSPDDITHWLGDDACPVVVAEEDGHILGFASTSAYSTRECYAGIREFSIYVHREAKRRGIARKLLVALCDAAAKAGCWKLTSRIFPENTASLELCKSLGFRVVGTHLRHAKLEGEWRDVVTVERLLDQG